MTNLSLAIPSYNRAPLLLRNLKRVAPHLPSWLRVVVIDNCSPTPVFVDDELRELLVQRGVDLRIVRNPANIGGGANILRCFEVVDTEWFFLCGDDDILNLDRIDHIRKLVESHPEAGFIKFSSRFHRYAKQVVGRGVSQLLNESGTFGALLFMSSYVFNRKCCLEHLKVAHICNSSYAPHVAVALMVSRERDFILSDIEGVSANESSPAWSPTDVVLSSYYLADLPLHGAERRGLITKIYEGHNLGREVLDISTVLASSARDEGWFLLRKAIRTHMFHGSGIKRVIALMLLPVTPLIPAIGRRWLRRLYERAAGRAYAGNFVSRHENL